MHLRSNIHNEVQRKQQQQQQQKKTKQDGAS